MDEEFTKAVEDGLKLAKRICGVKDSYQVAPRPPAAMERGQPGGALHPASPMVYAVIYDPGIVDNPDVPSYQPHVYGRMDPPALIPLLMNDVGLEAECYLDTALVTVRGSWRLHCVTASRNCDCRLVVPMGEQGSILGVEVEVARRSYFTKVIQIDENQNMEKGPKGEVGGLLKPQMFSLVVPQVKGGSVVSFKVRWLQKLLYNDGQFSISIPFTFPEFVNPSGKVISKREKMKLNINSGTGKEVLCNLTSHALKEIRRQPGSVGFLYEGEVVSWSKTDFNFSYTVYSNDIFGGVLLQSPLLSDLDQREIFSLYLLPGTSEQTKVFRKEVVFVVDISESMRGRPLDSVITALSAALSELTSSDSFSIIAFNEETYTFSSSLALATQEMVENATLWMKENCIAAGGTNILKSLDEAIHMLSNTMNSIPHVCLITDGAVENERSICSTMSTYIKSRHPIAPRISTFGIGSYCNHYFLHMLATIGRGLYDAAFEADSIDARLQRFFKRISSPILANVTVDTFDHIDSLEVYPSHIPDLLVGCPLILVGRYNGTFPDSLTLKGILADTKKFSIDLKVQKTKDVPLDKEETAYLLVHSSFNGQVFAKQQIDLMTAQAWFSERKLLEEKITKLSIQSGVASEFTHMVLQKETEKDGPVEQGKKIEKQNLGTKDERPTLVSGIALGFGNVAATAENLPPGFGKPELPEAPIHKKAIACCNHLTNCCCGMCCIQTCSRLSDQCLIVMTQLCTALSCFGCAECCAELCCDGSG